MVSVVVALVVGSIEGLGLLAGEFNLSGGLWDLINMLNNNFGDIGYCIIAIFILSWLVSIIVYRVNRYDDLELKIASQGNASN
jgi:high-affinity nickel-transport protein